MKVCSACQGRFETGGWKCPHCAFSPPVRDEFPLLAPDLAFAGGGFDSDYFNVLAGLEAKHFWFRSRNRLLVWVMKTWFAHARKFLEIGCGTGFVLTSLKEHCPGLELAGSEVFVQGLHFARQRLPQVELLQMDALRIPFACEFDVIGAFDVLEHIKDDVGVLKQMRDAVKPGGGIVITVPQHPSLWSSFDEHSHHQRRYTRRELVSKIENAGFRIRFVTSFVSFLLPVMYVARYRSNRSKDYDLFADLRLSRLASGFLELVMRLEHLLLRGRLSLPAGGSLLAVAYTTECQ